jgi:hypothetical protein
VGVKVSDTLKLLPVVNVVGNVTGLVSVNGPVVLTELMVPLAVPELVTVTIKLLVFPLVPPTFAPGNVIVPPDVTVVAAFPVIRTLYVKVDVIPLPEKLPVSVTPP